MPNKKSLIVYYSLEGNTRFVAESISKKIGADIFALKPKKEIKSKGFMRYIWGGREVILKKKPELTSLPDISKYDTIYLGSPIWADLYAPPIRTLLDKFDFKNKKLILFMCHSGGGGGRAFADIKNQVKGKVIKEIEFRDPLKFNDEFKSEFDKNF